jgi:hypothetical protein
MWLIADRDSGRSARYAAIASSVNQTVRLPRRINAA